MSTRAFYLHPNEEIRQAQADARDRALRTVSAGRVRWDSEIGPCGGFVVRGRFGRYAKPSLVDALALHELRAAGAIALDKLGRAVHTAQKVSA